MQQMVSLLALQHGSLAFTERLVTRIVETKVCFAFVEICLALQSGPIVRFILLSFSASKLLPNHSATGPNQLKHAAIREQASI